MSQTAPSPIVIHALEAALELASTRTWQAITLIEIAAKADIPMSDLYGVADKDTLTDALESWADTAMSEEAADLEDTPRDRLFDVIMRRFEHMETRRAGVLALMQARDKSPARLANLLQARKASAQWALSCTGLDHGNNTEWAAKLLGIVWAIGRTERAWRKDESGDFARTMATLDEELASGEDRLRRLGRFTRPPSASTPQSNAAPATPEGSTQPEAPPAETAQE